MNDEVKKKLVEIMFPVLRENRVSCNEVNACEQCWFPCEVDRLADSLADALIAAGIGDVSSEKAMRELAEAFYREKCAEYDLINYKLQKAEHRAEVAERALRIVCGNITKELWQDWHASWRTRNYYDEMIQQAKKELAGENGGKKEV